MKTTLTHTAGGFALALGLGGCGTHAAPATASDSKAVDESITQSFDRLRALQIIDVGQLVLNLPAEATSCYGVPCPNSPWQQPYVDERARQAPRLATLADVFEQASRDVYLQPAPMSQADAAIQSLTALQVIAVGGIVQAQPANNPQCYNLPCQSDIDAAQTENERRVAKALEAAALGQRAGL
jgi:hypothetical protein